MQHSLPRAAVRAAARRTTLALLSACALFACATDAATRPSESGIGIIPAGDPRAAAAALTGSSLYINPSSPAQRQADLWRSTRPADAAQMDKIASQPVAIWLGEWSGDVRTAVSGAVSRAAGRMSVFVAYNVPGRDCGGYSAGGISASAYRTWVRSIAAGLAGAPAVVVLEPDALAGMECLAASAQDERVALIGDAVDVLKAAGAAVYVDGGNARWQSADVMAARLSRAAVARADGFALNVSNFVATDITTAYGEAISERLGGKHFVIDVSRNGLGATSDGQWCNPSGRALGVNPTTVTGNALVDAYLWVKVPGESDGTCNGGPSAGAWWPEYALGLAQRQPATVVTPPPPPPPPADTTPPPPPADTATPPPPPADTTPAPQPEPPPPPADTTHAPTPPDTTPTSEPPPPPPPPAVNQSPIANVGGPYTGSEGSPITMSAAASSDPEGGALTYHWSFSDHTTATGATVAKTFAQSYRYTVTLTVTDAAGAASTASATVDVADVAPTATFVAPSTVRLGYRWTLALTNASDVAPRDHAAGFTYQFDCGQGWFSSWSTTSSLSCAARWTIGTRTVRARVRDRHDYGWREYRTTIAIVR